MKNILFIPGFQNHFDRWVFNEPPESSLRRGMNIQMMNRLKIDSHNKIRCYFLEDNSGELKKQIVDGMTICVLSLKQTGKIIGIASVNIFLHNPLLATGLWPDKSSEDCANILFFNSVFIPITSGRILVKDQKHDFPVPLSEDPMLIDAIEVSDRYGSVQRFLEAITGRLQGAEQPDDYIIEQKLKVTLSIPNLHLQNASGSGNELTNSASESIPPELELSITEDLEEKEALEKAKRKAEDAALKPEERLERQLDRWQSDLINLDRRNRLLYYRPYKMSTLEFKEPSASIITSRISSRLNAGVSIIRSPEDRLDSIWSKSLGTYEIRAKTSREEDLKKILLNLERKANQIWLDRGLWVLFLGIGMLEWCETDNPADIPVNSPLLMLPVELSHDGAGASFKLRRADGEVSLNPALIAKMKHDFEIDLELPEDSDDIEIKSAYAHITNAIKNKPNWKVKDEAVLSTFSFHKDPMFKDIEANRSIIKEHEIIKAIVLGEDANLDFGFNEIPYDQLDDISEPEEMNTILDADSSQRQAIIAAKKGRSFVLDGPPGTGKSQTISNIIAELIAAGKSVLFVSEKAAALDVVQKRLQAADLGDYILELHNHTTTRKELARILSDSLSRSSSHPTPMYDNRTSMLKKWRIELSQWAIAVNEKREPFGLSIIETVGIIDKNHDLALVPPSSVSPGLITQELRVSVLETSRQLSSAWDPVEKKEIFIWDRPSFDTFDNLKKLEVISLLETAVEAIATTRKFAELITEDFGIPASQLLDELERLDVLEKLLLNRPELSPELLSQRDLYAMQELIQEKEAESKQLITKRASIEKMIGEIWRDFPVDTFKRQDIERLKLEALGSHWKLPESMNQKDLLRLSDAFRKNLPRFIALEENANSITSLFSPEQYSWTVDEAKSLAGLGRDCLSPERPEREWIDPEKIYNVKLCAQNLSKLLLEYRELKAQVTKVFLPEIIEIDLEPIAARFKTDYSLSRFFRSQYWKDKRVLKSYFKTRKFKWNQRNTIQVALKLKDVDALIEQISIEAHSLLGKYWKRESTDQVSLNNAIAIAERAIDWLKRGFDLRKLRKMLASEIVGDSLKIQEMVETIDDEYLSVKTSGESQFPEYLSHLMSHPISQTLEALPIVIDVLKTLASIFEPIEMKYVSIHSLRDLQDCGRIRLDIDVRENRILEVHDALQHDFRSNYRDENSDWQGLRDIVAWTKNARDKIGSLLSNDFASRFVEVTPRAEKFSIMLQNMERHLTSIKNLAFPSSSLGRKLQLTTRLDNLASLLDEMQQHLDEIPQAQKFYKAKDDLYALGFRNTVDKAAEWMIPANRLEAYFDSSLLSVWLDNCLFTDQRLKNNDAEERNRIVKEFQNLDKEYIKSVPSKVINYLDARRPQNITSGQWGIIRHQAGLQRRHKPIRVLMDEAGSAVKVLKPCFMMSPLSVSQFIPSTMRFDTVIFDEASQVRPSDAINCIYRGSQLIVAGDPRQLPPTSFFELSMDDGNDYEDTQEIEYWESILDLCISNGSLKEIPLNWHYRSRHEHLIAFSNHSFYKGRLITFPSSLESSERDGVEFYYISNGVYRRGTSRDNIREAEAVVSRVIHHLESNPDLSLGIVALSEAQAATIERILDMKLSEKPILQNRVKKDRLSGLFVKNLETVQGDERDIIFISIGYGKDESGKFIQNFGPMNQQVGWRRLNVAVTRARHRVEVFSSINPSEINAPRLDSSVYHLKKYLEYAQSKENRIAMISGTGMNTIRDRENPFEDSVAKAIIGMGYDCVPQLGCSGYRIDLAVCHPEDKKHYVLAVECDGYMYHSSKVARDRDRLREGILEGLGWKVYRIWSSSWYRQRKQQEEMLRKVIQGAISTNIKKPINDIEIETRQDVIPDLPKQFTILSLVQYLSNLGYRVINNRQSGGSIWLYPDGKNFSDIRRKLNTHGLGVRYFPMGRPNQPGEQWEIDIAKSLV